MLLDLVTQADMAERDLFEGADYPVGALAAVSTAIREAAGSPITETTATICVPGSVTSWLDLPGPVRNVSAVTFGDTVLTADDFRVWPDRLWRAEGWGGPDIPVTITYTLGLPEVPADIAHLACELVAMMASGSIDHRVSSEGVDDYRVTYRDGAVTALDLPQRTRDALRARFSGGVSSVGSR